MKVTQKKIEANRRNARKGGPKTPEGKRKVSQNARTYGLTAEELVLSEEEKPEFEALQRGLQEGLQPAGAVLWLLFDEVVACAWQVRVARRCVQAEVHRMLEATKDEIQGPPAEGTCRTAMIIAGHPYTLTPFQIRGRMDFLDDVSQALRRNGRLGDEWKESMTAVFGADFWQSLREWEQTDKHLLWGMLLFADIEKKDEMYNLPPLAEKNLLKEGEVDAIAKAVRSRERSQMLAKLIEVKQQALQEALQYVVGVETGEATASGKNRLELFQRYQTTARRDFSRALEEYEKRRNLIKV